MADKSGSGEATSFVVWLLAQKNRRDEIGILAQEAARDRTFPTSARRLFLFLHYYDLEPANREAVKKAHAEWRRLKTLEAA